MTTLQQVGNHLQKLLIEDANRLGRSTGFIQRARKFSGASFAQTVILGYQADAQASLEALCQCASTCGVSISPQGLQERLNAAAADFLRCLLEQSLTYLVQAEVPSLSFLNQFKGVYLQDSTVLALPRQLHPTWRGSGNQSSISASMKVQTVFEYQQGYLHLQLHPGTRHDCGLQATDLPAGALRLADSAYFKVAVLRQLDQRGVWWLTRVPARVGLWVDGQVLHLSNWLSQQAGATLDCPVKLTAQQFACRLLAFRVPEPVAQQRRARVLADAKRKNRTLTPETLQLCEWTVVATNLPADQLPAEAALVLLRLRWQIELLFKLWKQNHAFDRWRSTRPEQILCEIYAKLIGIVLQHWLLLISCWGEVDRSLFKAAQTLRKQAYYLASVLPHPDLLLVALQTITRSLRRCTIQKRRARPATFQLLAALGSPLS
jgi:hypothetical protein